MQRGRLASETRTWTNSVKPRHQSRIAPLHSISSICQQDTTNQVLPLAKAHPATHHSPDDKELHEWLIATEPSKSRNLDRTASCFSHPPGLFRRAGATRARREEHLFSFLPKARQSRNRVVLVKLQHGGEARNTSPERRQSQGYRQADNKLQTAQFCLVGTVQRRM